jgi:hypothetical protein
MIWQTKRNFLIVGFACLILQLPKAGVTQMVLYDDLRSQKIDPSKWVGGQNYDPDLREATRMISGKGEARGLRGMIAGEAEECSALISQAPRSSRKWHSR